jgi:RimJ/RimL family protein N-acetyltransferase
MADDAETDETPSLDDIEWPLRTERLVLRRVTSDDLDATWAFRRLPEISDWLTGAPATREQYAERFLDEDRLASTLIVELPADGDAAPVVIGDLMVAVQDAWAQAEVADRAAGVQAELGWVLHPDHQGHGYAREAVAAIIRICFEDLRLRRVTAGCFAANEASWRLAEKLGMRREAATVKESLHRSGEWMDGYGYALLAEEWRAPVLEPVETLIRPIRRTGRPPRAAGRTRAG